MKVLLATLVAGTVAISTGNPARAGFVVRAPAGALRATHIPASARLAARLPLREPALPEATHPWIEGDAPALENQLFLATYPLLPTHNIVKIYVYDSGGFTAAGIRFSARVAHSQGDLSASEIEHEAAELIRATFDEFPEIQQLDVWATIPVPKAEMTSVQNTMFSVSADRSTYEGIRSRGGFSDAAFLGAFGRVWVSPEVPQQ